MKVVPGRPDLNAQYVIEQMQRAADRGIDIIIFPEMCIPGYFIGDKLENESFVEDVIAYNKDICKASLGITVVFGSIGVEHENDDENAPFKKGEDGRRRIYNKGIVATDGFLVGDFTKTLQPNYRFFNDDKHLYSGRKVAAELKGVPADLLRPINVLTHTRFLNLGVILCEDMWHKDYPENPTQVLVEKGADLIINLSASPWGWQKNRKRHAVVKELLQNSPVPFVYVNNTGTQNTGKNILVFDGSSTVYDSSGDIVHEVKAYKEGPSDFVFKNDQPLLAETVRSDTAELYAAMKCVTKEFFAAMPSYRRRAVIGISGGIDSAVVAALLVDVLEPRNVYAVNMPSIYSSQKTIKFAEDICENLGISYESHGIDEIVAAVRKSSHRILVGSLADENVQARARMAILATKAQADYGCIYTSNCNKTELAFGYGTMYADLAGFLAPLTDLIKGEVRQIAEYLNKEVFGREVIPQACIDQAPTAELAENQRDPFDYGTATRRGYHDELVRAFVEFGRDAEWVLAAYMSNTLEKEMGLDEGTLQRIFPSPMYFLRDLEKHWSLFGGSFIKRIQAPPVPVFSKRAFGRDFEEATMSTYYTRRYKTLRAVLVERSPQIPAIAIFGGSFNPPGKHHRLIVEQLSKEFDKVIVVPCGPRPDKSTASIVCSPDRAEMVNLAFGNIPNVEIDLFDINNREYTPTFKIDERYKKLFPMHDICHVVGDDLIGGGRNGSSEIQRSWKRGWEVWDSLNFAVLTSKRLPMNPADFPPNSRVIQFENLHGRSTDIRLKLAMGDRVSDLLDSQVESYIREHNLYRL